LTGEGCRPELADSRLILIHQQETHLFGLLHMPLFRLLTCCLMILVLLPGTLAHASTAEPTDSLALTRAAIRELVRSEMDASDTVGLSLALVDDQKVLWAEGFGYANREQRVPAKPETLYAVGDLSQLLTAMAVLQFAEQGTIRLDQPVREVLPEFSIRSRYPSAGSITVRQLLTHHAGLPAMHFRGMWTPKPESLAAFLVRLREEFAVSPPGEVFSPSFPGYNVLGRMVEVLCRQEFAACLKDRLLAPLGMTHSGFGPPPVLTQHYWQDKPAPSLSVRDMPAAGLSSSVTDLARLVSMLFGQGKREGQVILRAHSLREMLRVQNDKVEFDLDNHVGIAWYLTGVHFPQARRVAWLNNRSPFSRGRILVLPDLKLGVIVLTNSSGSTTVVDKVSERLMELVLEQRRLPMVEPPERTQLRAGPAPARRTEIEGHYTSLIGRISVRAVNHRYRAQTLGKTIELFPQPNGLLAPEYHFLGIVPIPISTLKEVRLTTTRVRGHDLIVAYYRQAAYRFGERISSVRLSPAWLKRLGEYRALNRDPLLDLVKLGNVRLAYHDGLLTLRYQVPGWLGMLADVPLRPVSDTELVVEGTGWLMGDTVRMVQHNGHEVLRYSGYEFRRIGQP
jgi:CubicO group peptidase (beta-lactamase class C family)